MNDMIPCVGGLSFVFLVFAFIFAMRYLNYQETLKLAEKGLVKPVRQNGVGKAALIWGIILTAMGLATTIGLWPLGAMLKSNAPFGFGPWMLVGLLPTFFGLALVLIHVLTREDRKSEAPPKDDSKE
jgi:hypothetical protein